MVTKIQRGKQKHKTAKAPQRQRAKRMPAANRKELIVEEAGHFFANNGFNASTRDLADSMGIRQPLLYKYFEDKSDLISAVLDRKLDTAWKERWSSAEVAGSEAEKVSKFFEAHLEDSQRLRLILRSVLDGRHLPQEFLNCTGLNILAAPGFTPDEAALRRDDKDEIPTTIRTTMRRGARTEQGRSPTDG